MGYLRLEFRLFYNTEVSVTTLNGDCYCSVSSTSN